jgi:hypothetical protein
MLGAVLALVSSVFIAAAPAGAATQTMNFTITGSSTIGASQSAQDFPSGSAVSLQVDSTTGDITGGLFSIPTYDVTSAGVTVHVTIADNAPPSGNINTTTGVAEILVHAKTTLVITAASATCTIGPFDVDLKTSNTGGSNFTGTPLTGTLTDAGFSVPAIVGTGTSGACPDSIAGAINGTAVGIGLPTTSTSETMTLTQTNQAVTTTSSTALVTTTTVPSTSTTAAAAAPANANPNFTG